MKKMSKVMSKSSTEKSNSYFYDKIIMKALSIRDFLTYYIEAECVSYPERY